MTFTPATGLAVWAVGTGWLVLYVILERLDPYWGEDQIDWIQAASAVIVMACYPLCRKRFAAWLAKRTGR
jgi:hypothetical protein